MVRVDSESREKSLGANKAVQILGVAMEYGGFKCSTDGGTSTKVLRIAKENTEGGSSTQEDNGERPSESYWSVEFNQTSVPDGKPGLGKDEPHEDGGGSYSRMG
jgi:hypothetical protein